MKKRTSKIGYGISIGWFCLLAIVAFAVFAPGASAQSGYFRDTTHNCISCHAGQTTTSSDYCGMCHKHGTHTSGGTVNVAGTLNKTGTNPSYAPGESVSVTISGGDGRPSRARAILYDQNGVELARSTGTGSPPVNAPLWPRTLSAPAPATPGTYTWKIAWYGNQYDSVAKGPGWTADPNNSGHGWETVSVPSFTVAAATAPAIATASPLPAATAGTAYTQTFTATGGTTPYGWSVSAGTLPAGLTLSGAGVLSGTPTAAGTYNFTVQVTGGGTATKAFTLTVNAAPVAGSLSVTPSNGLSSAGPVGGPFTPASVSYTLSNPGTTSVAWTAAKTQTWATLSSTGGTLAAGASATVTVSFGTGANSLAAGSYSDTVTFTNTTNGAGNTTRSVSLTVNAAAGPTITTASLPAGTVGTAYSQTLAATGGTTPYSWSVSAGTLPAGLSLSTTGVLGGTPTASGTSNFTVQVTGNNGASSTKAFALTINAAAGPTITTASLPAGTVGTPYSQTLSATGGTTPYSWSVSAGTLPAGLGLSGAGVLSGTPTAAGTSSFTVQVSGGGTATRGFTVTINTATATLSSLAITGPPSVSEGGTAAFLATATWSDGTTSNVTSQATWSTSLGTISAAGVLSAPLVTGDQTATVGASYASGGVTRTASRSVTVTDTPANPPGALNVTVTPPDSAVDVPVTTVITATSNESSDISTVFNANTFALRPDSIAMSATRAGDEEYYRSMEDESACVRSGIVVGTIAYDANRVTATFSPTCKLAHDRTYTATITPAGPAQQGSAVAAPLSWSFTTIARTPDTDNDGVEDGEDDLPGDDGEATPPKSRGKGKFRVSVKKYPGARLRNVTGISDTHSTVNQAGKPAGYEFRDGLLDYEIRGIPPGATVQVDLTFPDPVPAGSKVYLTGPAGFREIANPAIQGNTVTLTVTDGGAGDSDGAANGVIVDPVGVAVPVASGSGSVDLSTTGSSGGGCAVAPGNAPGGAGAVAPLLVLLFGMAVRRFRKPGRKE